MSQRFSKIKSTLCGGLARLALLTLAALTGVFATAAIRGQSSSDLFCLNKYTHTLSVENQSGGLLGKLYLHDAGFPSYPALTFQHRYLPNPTDGPLSVTRMTTAGCQFSFEAFGVGIRSWRPPAGRSPLDDPRCRVYTVTLSYVTLLGLCIVAGAAGCAPFHRGFGNAVWTRVSGVGFQYVAVSLLFFSISFALAVLRPAAAPIETDNWTPQKIETHHSDIIPVSVAPGSH